LRISDVNYNNKQLFLGKEKYENRIRFNSIR